MKTDKLREVLRSTITGSDWRDSLREARKRRKGQANRISAALAAHLEHPNKKPTK